jgi:hypothetical protein
MPWADCHEWPVETCVCGHRAIRHGVSDNDGGPGPCRDCDCAEFRDQTDHAEVLAAALDDFFYDTSSAAIGVVGLQLKVSQLASRIGETMAALGYPEKSRHNTDGAA